ncbi:MAG: DUF480 domain-containing protein [Pseudomonadales bacterium]|nr:DUF480 domain-containing protein [Pseudomonadales bacterium]
MPMIMTQEEIRVLGCLMEKSVVTPDQYPLSLNALTNACNQKSSREPVMSLVQVEVERVINNLQSKHVVTVDENFRKQVAKYAHRFCNTPFSDYQFDAAQFAVVCVLLLRGPRTPGEIKANSGRLHTFETNESVVETLNTLLDYDGGPLVAMLPRKSGRRDSEYVHLFAGEVVEAVDEPRRAAVPTSRLATSERAAVGESGLTARVVALEDEVAELREAIAELRLHRP